VGLGFRHHDISIFNCLMGSAPIAVLATGTCAAGHEDGLRE